MRRGIAPYCTAKHVLNTTNINSLMYEYNENKKLPPKLTITKLTFVHVDRLQGDGTGEHDSDQDVNVNVNVNLNI